MKRFLLLVMSICMVHVCAHADSYFDALYQYLEKSGDIDKITYEQTLKSYGELLYPEEKQTFSAAVDEYMSSQLTSDITSVYEPVFRKHVTLSELRELNVLYSDPHVCDLKNRVSNVVLHMQEGEIYAQFKEQLYKAAEAALRSNPMPADMAQPTDISSEYKEAFARYYKDSRTDEVLMSTYRAMGTTLINKMRDEGVEAPEEKADKMIAYVSRNLPTVLLVKFNENITMQELQQTNKINSRPCVLHAKDATTELSNDMLQLGIKLFYKVADWMNIKYPHYANIIRKAISEIE